MLEKFENAALFLRLGLPSRKRSFSIKCSANRRNLKTPAFRFFVWTDNIVKTELFENGRVTIIT